MRRGGVEKPWIVYIRYVTDPVKPDTRWGSMLIQIPHAIDELDAAAQARLELTVRDSQWISLIRVIPISEMRLVDPRG